HGKGPTTPSQACDAAVKNLCISPLVRYSARRLNAPITNECPSLLSCSVATSSALHERTNDALARADAHRAAGLGHRSRPCQEVHRRSVRGTILPLLRNRQRGGQPRVLGVARCTSAVRAGGSTVCAVWLAGLRTRRSRVDLLLPLDHLRAHLDC